MKIAQNTPDTLILDDRPWFLGGLLVLLILIFAGFGINALLAGRLAGLLGLAGAALWGVALVVFVRRTTVIFDRPTGQITRHVNSLRLATTTLWPISAVSKADIETRLSRNSRQAGRAPITPMHHHADISSSMMDVLARLKANASGLIFPRMSPFRAASYGMGGSDC